uniref:Uncharacterized protein n=1 Tax=Chromera velia CCMP2878 TaxID=1169474 RepID=A0A0G4H7K8_9ALVE|eukprot:Cvel_25001.t1-p1 / transcript=Cvel_25001.t1 / gene=Cvel_25001 / organism=Chromera_velia_CCMP2878 / gene_product=hypothetical protein / transcript_product=hypothetical protein / location=Cvel_scaffold2771:13840-15079(-) / protein_length=348 / sequence_SO=supercontig / SO=protein_coding / is_pseudo=false
MPVGLPVLRAVSPTARSAIELSKDVPSTQNSSIRVPAAPDSGPTRPHSGGNCCSPPQPSQSRQPEQKADSAGYGELDDLSKPPSGSKPAEDTASVVEVIPSGDEGEGSPCSPKSIRYAKKQKQKQSSHSPKQGPREQILCYILAWISESPERPPGHYSAIWDPGCTLPCVCDVRYAQLLGWMTNGPKPEPVVSFLIDWTDCRSAIGSGGGDFEQHGTAGVIYRIVESLVTLIPTAFVKTQMLEPLPPTFGFPCQNAFKVITNPRSDVAPIGFARLSVRNRETGMDIHSFWRRGANTPLFHKHIEVLPASHAHLVTHPFVCPNSLDSLAPQGEPPQSEKGQSAKRQNSI